MKLEAITLLLGLSLILTGCALHHKRCPSTVSPCPKWIDGYSTPGMKLPEGCKVRCDDVGCYVVQMEEK